MNNVQLITGLLENSKFGPLMQGFVVEAISHYAELVEASPYQQTDSLAWRGCAVEALAAIRTHLKDPRQ